MRLQTYEITFTGQAGSTLRAEFDDCQVTVGPGTTTLRAELPDQAALSGLVLRITGLGLSENRQRGAARRPHAAAPAVRRPWAPMTGRAGRASRRAGRRRDRPGGGTRKIMMPYSRCWSSLQLTGHADFWHPTRTITTDGDPIAAASSTRPGPTTLSPTSPRTGSSVGLSSAASSANTSGSHRS